MFEHQREQRIQEVERRVLRLIAAQHTDALRGRALLAPGICHPVRRQRQKRRILRFDLLPCRDRTGTVALLQLRVARQQSGPCTSAIRRERSIKFALRRGIVRFEQRGLRQLATVLRDFLEVGLLRQHFHPLGGGNRLVPVLFRLVNRDQVR